MTLHEIWEQVMPPERRWLGLVILGSFFIHLAGFFIFRVDPVSTRAYISRPRQVTLMDDRLRSENIMADNWTQWLDWRDPTAIALPWSPLPEPELPDLPSQPPNNNAWAGPPPRPFELPRDLPGTLAQKADALITGTPRQPMPIRVESPPPLSGSTFRLEGKLADRRVLGKPVLPQPRTDLSLKGTTLSVGVDARGNVISALVEESSGETSVDQLAVQTVQSWQFSPRTGPGETDWGRISIFWDLNEKRAPEPAPTP